jgi:hypothetical protein
VGNCGFRNADCGLGIGGFHHEGTKFTKEEIIHRRDVDENCGIRIADCEMSTLRGLRALRGESESLTS